MTFSGPGGPLDLSGRTALVTGGATGLGCRIAEGLAQAGASVFICGRRLDRCREACSRMAALGLNVSALRCDVSRSEEVAAAVAAVVGESGRLDILVNNAGVSGSASSIRDMSEADWDDTLAINLKGVFLCSRAALKPMIEQGGGKIINVASIGARKPLPLSGDYSASKAGVIALTRTMALELVRHNIQVNAISPGFFATELNPEAIEHARLHAARKIPAGRVGDAAEIRGLVVFLASQASNYIVGEDIAIDGGVLLR